MSLAGTTEGQHTLIEAGFSKLTGHNLPTDCFIRISIILEYVNLQKLYGRNSRVMAVLSDQCGLLVGKWPMADPLNCTLECTHKPDSRC